MATKIRARERAHAHERSARTGEAAWALQGAPAAWAGLATLACATLAPGLASAQGMDAGRPAQLGGPDRPLTIGAQVVTTYDSNPARGSDVAGEIRNVQKDEVIVSPSITVGYSRTVGVHGLALRGVFGYDEYTKNKDLSAEHIEFSATGNQAVGAHCSVNGGAVYNRGQSNLQDVTVTVGKNVIQTYSLDAGQSCGTATGLTESLNVNYGATHNSDSTLVDFNTVGVSGAIGYANHVVGNVSVFASYAKTNYVNVPALSLDSNDFHVTSVGVQVSRPIGARLSGSASVSYSRSREDQGSAVPLASNSSYSGLTASAGLSYIVGPRLRLDAELERNVSGSILPNVGYAIVNQASLTADYTVSSRISASFGGSWSRNSYRGRVDVVQLATPDWQETSDIFGSVSVQIGRRAAISLDARHERGNSDLNLYDYSSNRVSLTLSASI